MTPQTPPQANDKELREAIYGLAHAVRTYPDDFEIIINQKGMEELLALIHRDRAAVRQANVDKNKSLCGCPMCEHHTKAHSMLASHQKEKE